MEDGVSKTVKKHSENKDYMVKLPNGTEMSQSLFDMGSNEAFMNHVQEVLSFCDKKKYLRLCAEAEQALEKKQNEV